MVIQGLADAFLQPVAPMVVFRLRLGGWYAPHASWFIHPEEAYASQTNPNSQRTLEHWQK